MAMTLSNTSFKGRARQTPLLRWDVFPENTWFELPAPNSGAAHFSKPFFPPPGRWSLMFPSRRTARRGHVFLQEKSLRQLRSPAQSRSPQEGGSDLGGGSPGWVLFAVCSPQPSPCLKISWEACWRCGFLGGGGAGGLCFKQDLGNCDTGGS